MRSFIDHTETNIKNSVKHFIEVGLEIEEIEICPEDNIYQFVEFYMGLDNADVDLEDTFTKYFPSLQRRSALLTLVGTYEHEIERFCINYARQQETVVTLSDLKGKGLERTHLFLKKVVGLSESPSFIALKRIILLRNSCAHNDARCVTHDEQPIQPLKELVAEHSELLEVQGKEIILKEGLLRYVIDLFDSYIKEVEVIIKKS